MGADGFLGRECLPIYRSNYGSLAHTSVNETRAAVLPAPRTPQNSVVLVRFFHLRQSVRVGEDFLVGLIEAKNGVKVSLRAGSRSAAASPVASRPGSELRSLLIAKVRV